jgi:hypothetical protein
LILKKAAIAPTIKDRAISFEPEVFEAKCLFDQIKQSRWLGLGHGNLMDNTEMEGAIHQL